MRSQFPWALSTGERGRAGHIWHSGMRTYLLRLHIQVNFHLHNPVWKMRVCTWKCYFNSCFVFLDLKMISSIVASLVRDHKFRITVRTSNTIRIGGF
jgi:hypothetical protein